MGNAPKRKLDPDAAAKRKAAVANRAAETAGATAQAREFPWKPIGIGVGVLAAIAMAVFIGSGGGPGVSGIPDGTMQFTAAEMGDPTHVEGEVPHPEGDNPAGGPHNAIWLNCGIYDEPVPSENAVHALEHGAVWITYSNISEDEIGTLESVAQRRQRAVVSPEPAQVSPIRLTAWGHILEVDSADDERVVQFMNEFESSPTNTPEPGASCQGGVGSPIR